MNPFDHDKHTNEIIDQELKTMNEQNQEPIKTGPNFSHRVDTNFYESMMNTLSRAKGLADIMEVAGTEDHRDALLPDTIRSVSQAIRMEVADAISMVDALNRGWMRD